MAHREWLFRLGRELSGQEGLSVCFSFTNCKQLRQSAVAFLGGISRLVEKRNGSVIFNWATCSPKVLKTFQRNGFSEIFGGPGSLTVGHAVPYREDSVQNIDEITKYLLQSWLGRGWIDISARLTEAIVGRVLEIYLNAFEHGHSDVGVVTCGHHYLNANELGLTVVDFGVGIPANVRGYLKRPMPPAEALKWAFQRGNTTKRGETSRGIGLDLLKEFVKINHGRLEFFSHDAQAVITKENEFFSELPIWFQGTLVTITFQCDESRYQFEDEMLGPQRPLF